MRPRALIRDRNICPPGQDVRSFQNFDFDVDWQNNKSGDITVFTDFCLETVDNCNSKIKVAWLIEPPEVAKFAYDYIKVNWSKFDYIVTYIRDLVVIDKKFHFYPWGSKWIDEDDWKVYEKSKQLSIIASDKNFTNGHFLRHESVRRFGDRMDVMGKGYTPIDNKIIGLKDYRYSVVTENCKYNDYFTEKLLDCFLTGTVPIYYGFDNSSNIFNSKGIIPFDTIEDLEAILSYIGPKDYALRLESIRDNFEKAQKYAYMDLNAWNFFFKRLFERNL